MSIATAILTSDPNLLRCVLHRLDGQVLLASPQPLNAAGVGSYAPEEVLLQRFSQGMLPGSVKELQPKESSEALLYVAEALPLGTSVESTQPLRFREWLFCQLGSVSGFPAFKSRLVAELPPFLQRRLGNESLAEVAFALFLKEMYDVGAEDRSLEPEVVARLLGRAARRIQELSAPVGAARAGTINLIATSRRVLVASRLGEQPLHYMLLEGSDRCEACGLVASTPATEPRIRAHLRQRTVVVASRVASQAGWMEIPGGSAIAVDRNLGLHTTTF